MKGNHIRLRFFETHPPLDAGWPELYDRAMTSKYLKHINRDEIISITSSLIRQDTTNPPGNEYLCKDIVTGLMEALGMDVVSYEKKPGRANVIGRIGNGRKSIGFVSHMDVAPPGDLELWETPPFEPSVREGRIYGRGALDDKGAFACSYFACKAFLAEHPDFDGMIYLIAAAEEETGSNLGMIYVVEECGVKFDAAIVPDGGQMDQAILGEKGIVWLEITSLGIQAHGSTPHLGRNAIVPLAELIAGMKSIDLGSNYDRIFDSWTMNIGTIQGGTATNSVPASAHVTVDFRLPAGISKSEVLKCVEEKIAEVKRLSPDAEFKFKVLHESEPHVADRNSEIVRSFDAAAKRVGINMRYDTFGGNTVAKNLHFAGITTLVHCPGDDNLAHIPNEYVIIDDLVMSSVIYAETLESYFIG